MKKRIFPKTWTIYMVSLIDIYFHLWLIFRPKLRLICSIFTYVLLRDTYSEPGLPVAKCILPSVKMILQWWNWFLPWQLWATVLALKLSEIHGEFRHHVGQCSAVDFLVLYLNTLLIKYSSRKWSKMLFSLLLLFLLFEFFSHIDSLYVHAHVIDAFTPR